MTESAPRAATGEPSPAPHACSAARMALRLARVLAALVCALGFTVLVGWMIGNESLKTLLPVTSA